ncbi:MAG: lactate racemase domain-containing protein [Olsenella sp.]|jgi:hypothetical protein
MHLEFEYGTGKMGAELPDSTDVFITGKTVKDPQCLPQDWDSLYAATLDSIRHPIGSEPLADLAHPGAKVVIVIPDIIKGGTQPTSHRRVAIRACLDELFANGVKHDDVLLLFSNGLHPRTSTAEAKQILGEDLYNEFAATNQIDSHDSENYDDLVDLGYTPQGDHVIMNKRVYESDIAILIGHTQGNPYGGYSGGYKHCATGITHWRSIAAHHVPRVMSRPDFVPVSTHSMMRDKFNQQGMFMEEKMGKKFFCCDAVLDTWSRQIEINSGWAKEMQPIAWKCADKRTYVHWAEKKYDIVVMGMPTKFHYGDGMGTNPIMMMQAVSAQVIRHKRILSDHCVFVIASYCDGWFHDERWPYLREEWEVWNSDEMNTLNDMIKYGEYFATNEEYIRKYRFAGAFHPFHGFSMMSCGDLAEKYLSATYIVGAKKPGMARSMGLKTRATFEEAIKDATDKYTDGHPNILALPGAYVSAVPHLCMKDPSQNSHYRDDAPAHPCGC